LVPTASYILYACAIMGELNHTFVDRFGAHIDSLFYDIAHISNGDSKFAPSSNNAFFPLARHKSWFDGHSFATGMFPFGKSSASN
jgi:endo-1,3(4)-beta-glucanase